MAAKKIPITREMWVAYTLTHKLPASVSKATIYRRARAEGWLAPQTQTSRAPSQISQQEQQFILDRLRRLLQYTATDRQSTDEQVLRIVMKLRAICETWIEEVIQAGKLPSPKSMDRIATALLKLEKLEILRQHWIAKAGAQAKRLALIERVVRERPPEPHEMQEAGPSGPAPPTIVSAPPAGAS